MSVADDVADALVATEEAMSLRQELTALDASEKVQLQKRAEAKVQSQSVTRMHGLERSRREDEGPPSPPAAAVEAAEAAEAALATIRERRPKAWIELDGALARANKLAATVVDGDLGTARRLAGGVARVLQGHEKRRNKLAHLANEARAKLDESEAAADRSLSDDVENAGEYFQRVAEAKSRLDTLEAQLSAVEQAIVGLQKDGQFCDVLSSATKTARDVLQNTNPKIVELRGREAEIVKELHSLGLELEARFSQTEAGNVEIAEALGKLGGAKVSGKGVDSRVGLTPESAPQQVEYRFGYTPAAE